MLSLSLPLSLVACNAQVCVVTCSVLRTLVEVAVVGAAAASCRAWGSCMHAPSLWICASTAASAPPLAPLLICQGVKVKNPAGESLHGSGSGVADESLEVFAIRVHALHSRTTANFTRRIIGPLAGCTAHALMPTLSARHDDAALQDRRRSAVLELEDYATARAVMLG